MKILEAVDSKDKEGEDVDSTIYDDEEGDEFDDDDEDLEGGKTNQLILIFRGPWKWRLWRRWGRWGLGRWRGIWETQQEKKKLNKRIIWIKI